MDWAIKNRRAILWAAGFLLILWFFGSSGSFFQECIKAKQNADAEKTFYESVSHLLVALGVIRGCTGYFIHENGDAITAIATALLAVITYMLVDLERDKSRTDKAQLRAYVKASHHPPGIQWHPGAFGGGFSVNIRIKNFGRTPAEIIDTFFTFDLIPQDVPFPVGPTYGPPELRSGINLSLGITDEFNRIETFEMTHGQRVAVENSLTRLLIYGYVDYVDIFGDAYRSGYARIHDPDEEGNNLLLITEPGWNYDRRL